MRTTYILVLALLLFAVCGTAQAQCTVDTSAYAVYDSESVDNVTDTTADILTSVVVDGSASMSGSCGDLTYTTHTPEIRASLNNVGAYSGGDSVCADCYVYDQLNQDSGAVPFGVEYQFSYEGEVDCSAAGLVLSVSSGGDWYISLHRTTYRYASISNGICTYTVSSHTLI